MTAFIYRITVLYRVILMIVLCAGLASCATTSKKGSVQSVRLLDLRKQPAFAFNGKMSFSDGKEGGSGQLAWQKTSEEIQVVLKAPLSKKSWTLTESAQQASIKISTGEHYYSQSAADLLSNQIGWLVPWAGLQSWVIGQPTQNGQLEWDDDGQGYLLVDQGWVIQYSKLEPYGSAVLPHKIIARKEPYSIKLSIKSWQW